MTKDQFRPASVQLPPNSVEHDIAEYRGLLIAASLSEKAISILLRCDEFEAAAFKEDAIGRLFRLCQRISETKQ